MLAETRYLAAAVIMLALVWWTADRAMGEDNDPSVSLGGDWLLFRASGHALVALLAGVAGVLLAPEILARESGTWVAATLGGIVVLWLWFKWRENPT